MLERLEFTCWNGEVVRGAFIIDAHNLDIIAFAAVGNGGISGSHIRNIMLKAVETASAAYACSHAGRDVVR